MWKTRDQLDNEHRIHEKIEGWKLELARRMKPEERNNLGRGRTWKKDTLAAVTKKKEMQKEQSSNAWPPFRNGAWNKTQIPDLYCSLLLLCCAEPGSHQQLHILLTTEVHARILMDPTQLTNHQNISITLQRKLGSRGGDGVEHRDFSYIHTHRAAKLRYFMWLWISQTDKIWDMSTTWLHLWYTFWTDSNAVDTLLNNIH